MTYDGRMEFLAVLAALVPFALGGWVIGIAAYSTARGARARVARLEERVAALERDGGRRGE